MVVADHLAAVGEAGRSGVGDDTAAHVDHRHLSFALQRVDLDQPGERFRGAPPGPHQRQSARAVADVDVRLGRHRADARLGAAGFVEAIAGRRPRKPPGVANSLAPAASRTESPERKT